MSNANPIRRCEVPQNRPASMPDFYMPAMPPLGLIRAIERWVALYRQRRRFRRRFLPLLAQSDRILEDMGYRREDILWALRLPLRVDARRALQERRRRGDAAGRVGPPCGECAMC
ncbi:hypothetical protein QWY84_08200 [Aquisalimonas lutea]|uniref:hypothetical protein n=1 Tax=Aquisalimonas lutea TaxID=1327750 RepID=UPI0025B5907D|nr:hypothetical protein [Aquisalimonas lutea]MDN3517587.1 hypothetical protein [Aquisalimonas lutea]